MDARTDERARPPLHAVVSASAPAAPRRRRATTPRAQRSAARPLFMLLIAIALLGAIGGGLLRAGVALPGSALLGPAALAHAALMIGAFLGTVIGIERAVAVRLRAAFLGPLCSAAAAVPLLLGDDRARRLAAARGVGHLRRRQRARRAPPARRPQRAAAARCARLARRQCGLRSRRRCRAELRLVVRLPRADHRRRAAGDDAADAPPSGRAAAALRHPRRAWPAAPARAPPRRSRAACSTAPRCWRWPSGSAATTSPGAPCSRTA